MQIFAEKFRSFWNIPLTWLDLSRLGQEEIIPCETLNPEVNGLSLTGSKKVEVVKVASIILTEIKLDLAPNNGSFKVIASQCK